MKKLLFILPLFALTLAGCSNNSECDCSNVAPENEPVVNENAGLEKATQNCVDLWWTHSLIHSQTAAYGECTFPSGVVCDDQLLLEWQCDYTADTSSIDTEEKRLAGCEESVNSFVENIENGEVLDIQWEDESESWASFTRSWTVKYSKGWDNRKIVLECVADFVDWSISVTYDNGTSDETEDEEPMVEWSAIAE